MLNEQRMIKLLADYLDHRLSITGGTDWGKVVFRAKITVGEKKETVVAEAEAPTLDDLWLQLGIDFRDRVKALEKKGGDKKKLPISQRTALEKGIPGLYHAPRKK